MNILILILALFMQSGETQEPVYEAQHIATSTAPKTTSTKSALPPPNTNMPWPKDNPKSALR